MNPTKIKIVEKKYLLINWNDGSEDSLDLKDLRKNCPCATCLAERAKQNKMYIPIFMQSQISVKSINQIGKYAIQIDWNDGHNTGIYEYKFLKEFSNIIEN